MTYFYLNSSNIPVGPLPLDEIQKLVDSGVIGTDTIVCETGKEEWQPLSNLRASADHALGISNPPVTAPPSAAAQAPKSGYPSWGPIASIISGVLAILTSCVPIFGFLFAAAALITGVLALTKARLSQGQRSLALAGASTGALAALISLVVFVLGFMGILGSSDASAIEAVLKKDAQIVRAAKSKFPGNSINQTRYIASQMQGIDTSRCPPDFRYAFQQHVNAWEQSVPYISSNTGLTAFFEGLYAGYTEDYRALGAANYQAQVALQHVNSTFAEVKSISAKYGAKIPRM